MKTKLYAVVTKHYDDKLRDAGVSLVRGTPRQMNRMRRIALQSPLDEEWTIVDLPARATGATRWLADYRAELAALAALRAEADA